MARRQAAWWRSFGISGPKHRAESTAGPGRKLDRKMLGRVRDAAIKLDPDECVTSGVHIGEGLKSCLAAWLAGFHPVWALGSASAIASFPALSAVEAVTVLGDSQRSSAFDYPPPSGKLSRLEHVTSIAGAPGAGHPIRA